MVAIKATTRFCETTEALCPECLRAVRATIKEVDGRIWLERECPRHGETKSLLASNADQYCRLRQYVPARMGVAGGCCGGGESCAGSSPPVCVLLLEITQACNLRCPTCYADAHGHEFMSISEARERLDAFFRTASRLDVLMLSGGEPTIHPEFPAILALALEYPIGRILINTNGLRLQQDPRMLDAIGLLRDRVELFFSFASFRCEVHERLYGRDLRKEKLKALELAKAAGVFVTLVPTIERGVNDDEIGELYRFALSMDNINGLNFQPVMSAGRYEHSYDGKDRMTLTDVIQALEDQTDGALCTADFVALPCSHADCCALTYGFLNANRTIIQPLPRHLDVGRYLDMFSDRISFAGLMGSAARRVWSDVAHLRARRTLHDLAMLYRHAGVRELLPLFGDPHEMGRRIFRIVIKPFMDAHTYDSSKNRTVLYKNTAGKWRGNVVLPVQRIEKR